MQDNELAKLLLEEFRSLRSLYEDDRKERREEVIRIYEKIEESNKDITTLKTRFMMVALTMGLAGGKIGAILPFLK